MIIYLDENIPPHLARGFDILQAPENIKKGRKKIEVKYLSDVYGTGSADLDWIPQVGAEGSFVITQDVHISKRKDEVEAYRKNGVGLFFLRGTSKKSGLSVWEMVQILAKNWEDMMEIILKEEGAFAYTILTKIATSDQTATNANSLILRSHTIKTFIRMATVISAIVQITCVSSDPNQSILAKNAAKFAMVATAIHPA